MTERAAKPPTWDLAAIGARLNATSEPRPDPILGNGVRLQLGRSPGTELELFPAAGVVRIATPDVHVALVRHDAPTIDSAGVIFDHAGPHGVSRLAIAPDGVVALTLTPAPDRSPRVPAPERPVDASTSAKRPSDRVSPSQPVADNPAVSDDPSRDQSDDASDEQGEKTRVHLQGRLGAAPRFRTTVNDKLIVQFPLAVHNDDKSTTWHTVVAFGDKAAQIQAAELKKGEPIGVIGYEHERTYTKKDGTVKTEIQIYAAVVKRR
jgi:Single-strand binding protein family